MNEFFRELIRQIQPPATEGTLLWGIFDFYVPLLTNNYLLISNSCFLICLLVISVLKYRKSQIKSETLIKMVLVSLVFSFVVFYLVFGMLMFFSFFNVALLPITIIVISALLMESVMSDMNKIETSD